MIGIKDILQAFDDVSEAQKELRERQSEYTGYSPSYALESWFKAEENAKKRLQEALDAYIDARIAAVVERIRQEGSHGK